MRALYRLVDRVALLTALLGVAAYAAATLVTVADILARQWGGAVPGVVDIVQLFILAGAYLVIPYTFLTDGHVSVDLLTGALPPRPAAVLKGLAAVLALVVLLPMLVKTYQSAMGQLAFGDRSQTIGIPMIWYWAPLVFGVGLSALAAALLLGRHVLGLISGSGRSTEPAP